MISLARQSTRSGRRTDWQRWLNGDTVSAFVTARSRFGEGFGNSGVAHSSDLQTSLARQSPDLLANPPDRSLFGCITAEFPTTDLLCKSAPCPAIESTHS